MSSPDLGDELDDSAGEFGVMGEDSDEDAVGEFDFDSGERVIQGEGLAWEGDWEKGGGCVGDGRGVGSVAVTEPTFPGMEGDG